MKIVSKLCAYMKARAAHEGVEWRLTENYVQRAFNQGVRAFFGVELDEHGVLLTDHQRPTFFRQYHQN